MSPAPTKTRDALTAIIEAKLTENWYRLSRYENPDQAEYAIKNVAVSLAKCIEPWVDR